MKYNFDKIINRSNTNALSIDGYHGYLFNGNESIASNYKKEELIRMWVADMDFAVAPEIINALKERLDHPLFGYSIMSDPAYGEAFKLWCINQYDWHINLQHLQHAQGIIPALFALIDIICGQEGKVLFQTPSYAFFKHACDHNQVGYETSDLIYENGQFRIDFDDFKIKTAQSDVRLFILCHPHNPTGICWSDNDLKRLGDICFDNNVMIISDEIHCDLLRQDRQFTPLAKLFPDSDQIITCMAPSKTFNLAGFMFANVVIPNEHIRTEWNQKVLPIVNPLSVVAAQTAYEKCGAWLTELKRYLDMNFEYLDAFLKTHLPKAKFKIPDATYLAWVDMSEYFDSNINLTEYFANHAGVLLEGGNMFVSNAEGFIRLNLACPRARLEEGLERIKACVVTGKLEI